MFHLSSLYVCMVNTIYLFSFVQTPRKFIVAELSISKSWSSSVLIVPNIETRTYFSFPSGKYVLVDPDQYFWYLKVEFTTSTSFEATRKKLKKIISTHRIRESLQSDNRPLTEFAKE